jgi:hypothetical protein
MWWSLNMRAGPWDDLNCAVVNEKAWTPLVVVFKNEKLSWQETPGL